MFVFTDMMLFHASRAILTLTASAIGVGGVIFDWVGTRGTEFQMLTSNSKLEAGLTARTNKSAG